MHTGPDVVIVPYRDGPYLVRGPVAMRDQDGNEVTVWRRAVALCRCGKSQMRPFCDGTHQLIRFRAPSEPERPFPAAVSEAAGRHGPAEPAVEDEGRGAGGDAGAVGYQASVRRAAVLVQSALDALLEASPDSESGAHLRTAVAALRETARELRRE